MVVLLFIAGTIIGSFLNVIIYRMPRGRSIVRPPSACPECGAPVRPRDNIPVVSFLLLRGRCRDCGTRIPLRYPVVEILAGLIPVLIFAMYGAGAELAVYWPVSCALLVITFVDLDLQIIPDKITLPGLVAGLVVSPATGLTTLPESLIGAVVGGGVLYLIGLLGAMAFRKESMGGGDIKLAAMMGAFLGWKAVLLTLFIAFFVGAAAGVAVLARRGRSVDHTIPFGPFLALGSFVSIVWAESLLAWYLKLLS